MRHIAQQIHYHLKGAKKVVIVPHQNPDGDAMGAATAFREYLTTMGKDAVIFCTTHVTNQLHFIPHSSGVSHASEIFTHPDVDTVVVLDSGDLVYAGVAHLLKDKPLTIINIDHHATNQHYGHINLVVPTAASTTEILYHYFRHITVPINQKMATSLLTGLTTDTGNFSNSATSAAALSVGGELIRSGGNYNLINDSTLKNKSVGALKLWGKVLSRLTSDERSGITYTYITLQDLRDHNVAENESEGIANFLNNLDGAKIAMILKEIPGGKVKGSFRTTRNDVDVSLMAKQLGGGGHKKAAGFTIDGTVEEALKKILTMK